MQRIIELQLERIARRIKENYGATFTYAPKMVTSIAERCKEVESGARNIDHILNQTLLPELSAEFLAGMAEGKGLSSVHVAVCDDGTFEYHLQ